MNIVSDMKITIEESPNVKWIFDTDEIPHGVLRNHLLKSVEEMLTPIDAYMREHGKILSVEVANNED